jgi:hypothetical protein
MEPIEFLPLVKAYPALSSKYGEVSCIAGVRTDGEGTPAWIRLYPVAFRSLDRDDQFAKYQPIRVPVEAHGSDRRPETRRPDQDSIEILGPRIPTADGWRQRRPFVEPLMAPSMCDIQRRQQRDGTSLGVFKPAEVLDLVFEPVDVDAGKQAIARAWAAQPSLLQGLDDSERSRQLKELEVLPWRFKYHYRCADPECRTHTQSVIDWEIAQFYRNVRKKADWQVRMRQKWIDEMCGEGHDTAFFVGNQHQHPTAFLVLGVWWPEWRPEQLTLGD